MRFVESTITLIFTQSLGLAVGFIVSIIVSRAFGPEGKGAFSLVLSLATILFGFSNLGLGFASQYFLGRRPSAIRGLFGNLLFYPVLASAVVVSGFVLGFPIWQQSFKGLTLVDLWPAFMMLPLMLVFEASCQLLVSLHQIGERTIAVITQSSLVLIVISILINAEATATDATYAYAFGWLVGGGLAVAFVIRLGGTPSRPSLKLFSETFRYSAWVYLANFTRELFLRVDFFVLYMIRTPSEAGIYSVALSLTSGLTIIMTSVQATFFPKTSTQSDAEAYASTPFYYRQMILVMFAASLAMVLAARPLLTVFGSEFLAGIVPMIILLAGMAVKGLNAVLSLHILGRGKPRVHMLVTSSTLVVSVLLNLWLVPEMGMNGAALATLASFTMENGVLVALYGLMSKRSVAPLFALSRTDLTALRAELVRLSRRLFSQAWS